MRASFVALWLSALGASGCASLWQMKMPSSGGPRWVEIQSDHFLFDTDLSEPDARLFVEEFEDRRAALIASAFGGAAGPQLKTRVVAFRNKDELDQFASPKRLGFWKQDLVGEKWMVLAVAPGHLEDVDFDALAVATHEMVHDLESFYFATQPDWLMEGLASFFETLDLDHQSGTYVVGSLSDEAVRPGLSGLGAMLAGKGAADSNSENLGAWLVFYLVNREREAFGKYQQALVHGDEEHAAWAAAFPDYAGVDGPAHLTAKLAAFFKPRSLDYKMAAANFLEYAGEEALRPISEAELFALRGTLFLLGPHDVRDEQKRRAAAGLDADAALALDPALPMALQLRVYLTPSREAKLKIARAASAARPDEALSWLLLDEAMGDEGTPEEQTERIAALKNAVELNPDSAWALQRLARALAQTGHAADGLALVRRSLSLFPGSAEALDTAALIAAAQGSCDGALKLETMAIARLPAPQSPDSWGAQAATLRDIPVEEAALRARLKLYADGCKTASPAP